VDVFHVGLPHNAGRFSNWHNQRPIDINPREAAVEFISKCRDRGVHVGLSSWLEYGEPSRNEQVEGGSGLVRIWDETLTFLSRNDCLEPVIYVDVLNEYPLWNGFEWLRTQLKTMPGPKSAGLDSSCKFSPEQKAFYNTLMNDVLRSLKAKWPQLAFFASQTQNLWEEEETELDYSSYDLLDIHLWMMHHDTFAEDTGYFEHMHGNICGGTREVDDSHWAEVYGSITAKWQANKDAYAEWMERKIARMAEVANKWNLPLGNTEGWAMANWTDHPALGWDWVKEAAEMAARLGAKYGYRFNCTSNFCMPSFKEMWDDVAWHQHVTSIIRSG